MGLIKTLNEKEEDLNSSPELMCTVGGKFKDKTPMAPTNRQNITVCLNNEFNIWIVHKINLYQAALDLKNIYIYIVKRVPVSETFENQWWVVIIWHKTF